MHFIKCRRRMPEKLRAGIKVFGWKWRGIKNMFLQMLPSKKLLATAMLRRRISTQAKRDSKMCRNQYKEEMISHSKSIKMKSNIHPYSCFTKKIYFNECAKMDEWILYEKPKNKKIFFEIESTQL